MLMDKLRDGAQSRVAKIIFWLIILSFALAGVGSYLNRPASNDPAVVDDEVISSQTLEQSYQNERSSLQAQYGESASKLFENQEYLAQLKRSVLDRLINQVLLNHKAQKAGVRLGDEQVKEAIRQMKEFQTDDKFDNQKFVSTLSRFGFTPESFANTLRQDLTRDLWLNGLLNTDFTLPGELSRLAALYNETRDVKIITVPAAQFEKSITLSDEDVKAYYDAHGNEFMHPEMVKVNFVVLDAANIAKNIKPSESDLKNYYEQHESLFTQPAKRKVAHILITDKDDAKAKEKAEAILKQLKGGADFAALAKADSADTLSARNGGELDWFEKGVMDPAFENAAFALQDKGELSDVVKSSFGYHIIKLIDKEDDVALPYEKVADSVREKYLTEKAHELFLDQQQQMSDVGFENPDSLDQVADTLKLKVNSTDFISSSNLPADINVPAVSQAAFSAKLRDENTNSEVITVSEDKSVMLHVIDYKQAAVKPFDEVAKDAKAKLLVERETEKAKEAADSLLTKVKTGSDVTAEIKSMNAKEEMKSQLSRFGGAIEPDMAKLVFAMPKDLDKSVSATVYSHNNGDASVVLLQKVSHDSKPNEQLMNGLSQQLLKLNQDAVYRALLSELKEKATIKYGLNNNQQSTD